MRSSGVPDPLVVLIDDTRSFADDRRCLVARSSAQGVELLDSLRDLRIDELWLDHDLGRDDEIWPVVRLLEQAHMTGQPFDISRVFVQAARSGPAHHIVISMRRLGLPTERSSSLSLWVRSSR